MISKIMHLVYVLFSLLILLLLLLLLLFHNCHFNIVIQIINLSEVQLEHIGKHIGVLIGEVHWLA